MMPAGLEVRVLAAGDARSDDLLDRFFEQCPGAVAQQTPGWRNTVAPLGPDEPMFLGCFGIQGQLLAVLPAYQFSGPQGSILTSAPQAGALGGVALRPGVEAEPVYAQLVRHFVQLARDRGCVVASLVSNPFAADHALLRNHLQPEYLLQNQCQALDLQTAVDGNRFPLASENALRNLRKASAASVELDEQQTQQNVDEWYELHAGRHREIGATPLPKGLFDGALREMVPRDKARFFFIRQKTGSREMAAGGLYLYHGQVIDALMPSIRSSLKHLRSNYLLAAHTLRWARDRGLRHYNWQGSPPEGGVRRFKMQWGSRDLHYFWMSRITGSVEPILRATPAQLREGYPWHFVVPYDRVGPGRSISTDSQSSREAAWKAMQPDPPSS
jgi:hypothetical protein